MHDFLFFFPAMCWFFFLFFLFACCKILCWTKTNLNPTPNLLCMGKSCGYTKIHGNPTLKPSNKQNKIPRNRTRPDQFNTFYTKRRKPEQQQQRLEWHPGRAAWEPAPRASAATSTGACWREVGSPVLQPGYRTDVANLCVTQTPIIFFFFFFV